MEALLLTHNADESAILRLALQRAGFSVHLTTNIDQALQSLASHTADLALLTWLNQYNISHVRRFRSLSQIPLIIISDPLGEDLHVDLLEQGADLVITRPYSTRLLISQVRTLLRRSAGTPITSPPALSVGDISIDPSVRTVKIGDNPPIHLTRLEFQLLYTLINRAGQVIPTETLVEYVWGYTGKEDRDLVRGLVKRLRAKIEPDPRNPKYIETISGIGYKLNK